MAGVEDPRVNLQSILTRHFLIRHLAPDAGKGLFEEEYRFSAAMNWLLSLAGKNPASEELDLALFGLRKGADNVEGLPIPAWLSRIFVSLPRDIEGLRVPNYIESFLQPAALEQGKIRADQSSISTFCGLWREILGKKQPGESSGGKLFSVLEPACGSANDYRFFSAYGLGPLLEYAGFDLCETNISNAKALFPGIQFATGNVFEIAAAHQCFDFCVVHDLFEHLSAEGLEAALKEVCRVTRRGLCLGFFQMDEIPEHVFRPVEDYHWNLLSLRRTREFLAAQGFASRVFHISTFLRQQTGCDEFHNPQAYTLWLWRVGLDEAQPSG